MKLKRGEGVEGAGRISRRNTQTDRTTNLLIVILVLFLMAELPLVSSPSLENNHLSSFTKQAILGMLSAVLGQPFLVSCYNPLGEVMDMLALTNCSINFILYCLMSTQFRTTLLSYIRPQGSRSRSYFLPQHNNLDKTNKQEVEIGILFLTQSQEKRKEERSRILNLN